MLAWCSMICLACSRETLSDCKPKCSRWARLSSSSLNNPFTFMCSCAFSRCNVRKRWASVLSVWERDKIVSRSFRKLATWKFNFSNNRKGWEKVEEIYEVEDLPLFRGAVSFLPGFEHFQLVRVRTLLWGMSTRTWVCWVRFCSGQSLRPVAQTFLETVFLHLPEREFGADLICLGLRPNELNKENNVEL